MSARTAARRAARIVSATIAAASLTFGTITLAGAAQDRADRLAAQEDAAASLQQLSSDRTFTSGRLADLSADVAKLEEAKVEEAGAVLADAVEAAIERLDSSKDKVLEEEVREQLSQAIESAEGAQTLAELDEVTVEVVAAHEAVDEAVGEWEAEQERLAEERRRAEEAARRAAAEARQSSRSASPQASATSSSGSSSGSRSSSNGSSGGGVRDIALAALARHGCGSVPVYWDDPRLAGWNGAAMIGGNEQILLNSRMPVARAGYVAAHECAHILQSRAYGHDLNALGADLDRIYGGNGVEQNADCITQRWGYGAWNYTRSCGGERGAAAAAIASGNRAS